MLQDIQQRGDLNVDQTCSLWLDIGCAAANQLDAAALVAATQRVQVLLGWLMPVACLLHGRHKCSSPHTAVKRGPHTCASTQSSRRQGAATTSPHLVGTVQGIPASGDLDASPCCICAPDDAAGPHTNKRKASSQLLILLVLCSQALLALSAPVSVVCTATPPPLLPCTRP